VTGADFKSVGPGREFRLVGFDSHTPPPIHFRLPLVISSDLIAAMRTAKLIITTLLALELFATTGWCAGSCCVADFNRAAEKIAPPEVESKRAEPESKAESGHCPMHAGKSEKPKPQPSPNPGRQSAAAQNHCHSAKSPVAPLVVDARFCVCNVEREEPGILSQRSSEQRLVIQAPPGASSFPHRLIDTSPPPGVSPDSFRSHSPPFSGSQLNLRI